MSEQSVEIFQERYRQLSERLEQLESRAGCFDRRFLQVLLQKMVNRPSGVADQLLDRVESGLDALEQKALEGPAQTEAFSPPRLVSELRALRRDLDRHSSIQNDDIPQTLAEALAMQSRQLARKAAGRDRPATADKHSLKAARRLEALRVLYRQDHLIAAALEEQPAAPGPLNPQGLLIRALSEMRDISPAYLARLVGYSSTLLWLERSGKGARKERGGKT